MLRDCRLVIKMVWLEGYIPQRWRDAVNIKVLHKNKQDRVRELYYITCRTRGKRSPQDGCY